MAAIDAVVVTAMGSVSSVGLDAATTCASIRAGLTRPAPVPGLSDVEPESQTPETVDGHPVGTLGDGFVGPARWLQLLVPCLHQLCAGEGLPPFDDAAFWGGTAAFLVTPYLDDERYYPNPRCTAEGIRAALVVPLQRKLGGEFNPRSIQVVPKGRVAIYELVAQFSRMRQTEGFARALVLVVDSWLDGPSLSYLMTVGRLKNNDNPVGLMPGEGAFGLLLEARRDAEARRASGAVIRRCGHGVEPHSLMAGERSDGLGLAYQLGQVLGQPSVVRYPTHVLDLNGEAWRAAEWGSAMVRLQGEGVEVDLARQWLPALSVGDVGAGTSALGIIIAARALARGYARGSAVLLSSSDEHGDVGAMLIEKE